MKSKILLFAACFFIIIDSLVLGLFSYLSNNIILELAGYLYTFFNDTSGTANDVFINAAKHVVPFVIAGILIVLVLVYFFRNIYNSIGLYIL